MFSLASQSSLLKFPRVITKLDGDHPVIRRQKNRKCVYRLLTLLRARKWGISQYRLFLSFSLFFLVTDPRGAETTVESYEISPIIFASEY